MKGMRLLPLVLAAIVMAGCSSGGGSRYSMKHDKAPERPVDVSHVKDAVPRVEPKSRGGNRSPYRVLGKTYYVMDSAQGYRKRGIASWYGRKFHGHKTSNGEVYDMYGMTAAHKSLPLPTYLQVTNLANGKKVIVRVNDRGPFHDDRLIDLSYAAASKLGMLGKGTAHVELVAIDPRAWQSPVQVPSSAVAEVTPAAASVGRYLQVGAFSLEASAERVRQRVTDLTGQASRLGRVERDGRSIYRVLLGPLGTETGLDSLISELESAGYSRPHLVDMP